MSITLRRLDPDSRHPWKSRPECEDPAEIWGKRVGRSVLQCSVKIKASYQMQVLRKTIRYSIRSTLWGGQNSITFTSDRWPCSPKSILFLARATNVL